MTLETIIEAQEETIIEGQATEDAPVESVEQAIYRGAQEYAKRLAPVVYSSNSAINKYILNAEVKTWDEVTDKYKEDLAEELTNIVFNWPNFNTKHYHNGVHAGLVQRGYKYGETENHEKQESPLCVYEVSEAPTAYRVIVNNTVTTVNAFIDAEYGHNFPYSIVVYQNEQEAVKATESSDPLAEIAEEEAVNTESVNQ